MTKGKQLDLSVEMIVAAIKDNPTITLYELANEFGCHHSTVYLRIVKARDLGLLPRSRKHRDLLGLKHG
jgi:predicted transcriptional regulator